MVPIQAEAPERMRIRFSRVRRLLRRKMQVSDRASYLQSLISAMKHCNEIRGINPGGALIQLRSPHWELYVTDQVAST